MQQFIEAINNAPKGTKFRVAIQHGNGADSYYNETKNLTAVQATKLMKKVTNDSLKKLVEQITSYITLEYSSTYEGKKYCAYLQTIVLKTSIH